MTSVIEKYIELSISVFLYITSAALTLTLLVLASDPIITQGSDKSFVESAGIQQVQESTEYGRDLLLMLLNTDPMTPYPRAIKINDTPVIKLDNDFIAAKMRNISAIYSASGPYKLSTMLNYKIASYEYVYEGTGAPYIQYRLEVAP